MKVLAFVLLTSILTLPSANSSLTITEIMYNPIQDDNYNEWVELYNPTTEDISLEGWKICNNQLLAGYVDRNGQLNSNNTIVVPADSYAVITDGGSGTEVYNNFNISGLAFHVDASSLCGGLSNTGDSIQLYNGSQLIENITYSNSRGANGDGNSLQKIDNVWISCSPTLGLPNCQLSQTTTSTTSTTILQSDTTTTTTPITATSIDTTQSNTCDLSLTITTDQIVFNADAAVEYKITVEDLNCQYSKHNFKIEHWIEDLYNNVVKGTKISEDEITCKKTKVFQWTPKNLIGSEGYLIKAKIIDFSCIDSNSTNDNAENLIVVKGTLIETSSTTTTSTMLTTTTTQKITNKTVDQTTTTKQEAQKITGKAVSVWGKIMNFFKSLFSFTKK